MHSRHKFHRLWGALSALLVLALVLGACGGTAQAPAAQPQGATAASTGDAAASATTGADTSAASQPVSTDKGSLVLLEWSGFEDPAFREQFTAQYPNVKPEYSLFSEDAEAFAKLQSGFEVDLVHPCNSWWQLYVDEGLVQPIDTSKIKDWASLDPKLTAIGKINGQQYFVPWDWGYESVLVRTDKVQHVPESWADLAKPEYAGHLALWDSGESNHIVGALVLGFDPWKTTPEQDEQIKQWLIDLKPNLLTYWVDFTELAQLMASGDVWVASNAWADTYRTLLDEQVPVTYIEPKEGRLGYVCGFGISSKTENPDLAYAYLNAVLDKQSMANFSNTYGYGAANRDALPLIKPEVVNLMQLDKPEALERAVFYQSLTPEQREKITTMWNDVKAAP